MAIVDFTIPLNLEDLEDESVAGRFLVMDSLALSEIEAALSAAGSSLNELGPEFIFDHFTTFYCLIKHFKKVAPQQQKKGLKILSKAFQKLSLCLGEMLEDGINDSEVQFKYCNIAKMLAFVLVELAKRFQDVSVEQSNAAVKTKGKKSTKTDVTPDWTEEKLELMSIIYDFLQLPIKMLWDPPAVDEEFTNIFSEFCYKCLEDPSITGASMKQFRSHLFQVLSTLIKKHFHGLSFSLKAVQLLRMHDHLVNPLAQGVVDIFKSGCTHVVREIVREMGESDESALGDTGGARSLSQFLTAVAEASPSAVASAAELLLTFLGRDPPTLRCCALSILGEVVEAILTKDDLDENLKSSRDLYLETLEEHLQDCNAFARTRALQVWQKLCAAKAVPVARMNHLLELAIGKLVDKSAFVKKQAVQLVKIMLEGNPYSGQLDVGEISTQLKAEKAKLEALLTKHKLKNVASQSDWDALEPKLREELLDGAENSIAVEGLEFEEAFTMIVDEINRGNFRRAVGILNQLKLEFNEKMSAMAMTVDGNDDEDVELSLHVLRNIWENSQNVPNVSEEVIEKKEGMERNVSYLEGALEFAQLIDRALPMTLTLLESATQTDVLEAISFFTAAYQFGFDKSADGVRRMLELVFSKEENVRKAVCEGYRELYFSNTAATGRNKNLEAVRKMSSLVIQLDPSQMRAMEEVVKEWVRKDVLDKPCIQVLFERFSKKIPGTTDADSWAALVIISMIGAEQPNVIRKNLSVLLSEGLGPRGGQTFPLAQFTCKALMNLKKSLEGNRLAADDEILLRLRRLLRVGLWSGSQHDYIPFAEEALALVFALAERPDLFSEELIKDMFKALKEGKKPVVKHQKGRVLVKRQEVEGDLFSTPETVTEPPPPVEEPEVNDEPDMSNEAKILRLTRFISIVGTVAGQSVDFLENRVLNEYKRRHQVEFERKNRRYDEKRGNGDVSLQGDKEELVVAREMADENQKQHVSEITEDCLASGTSLLGKFLPFIQNICTSPKYNNQPLKNAALNTLGMFMQVSSKICEANLQLLVSITRASQSIDKRRNGLMVLWALQLRFPSKLNDWTSHMVELLNDGDTKVRRTAVIAITHLIGNEMIKTRNYVSSLAARLVDKDVFIAQTTRQFFREFAQKGTSLFNVLPSLVTTLSGPDSTLEEDEFHTIIKFVMNLVTKDKQQDLLAEKLCQYFECATTDRQCRDLAFTLTLLNFSEKSLRKILDNFRCFGNKLYIAEVFEAFTNIISQARRNPHKEKGVLDELQALLTEYREKSCVDRNISVSLPSKKCPPSTRKRGPRRRQLSGDSGDEEVINEEVIIPRSTRKAAPRRTLAEPDSEPDIKKESSDDDAFLPKKTSSQRLKLESSESDSGEAARKVTKASKKSGVAKKSRTKTKKKIVVSSDSDDDHQPRMTTRKR